MPLSRWCTPVLVAMAAVPMLAAPAAASKGPDSRGTGVHQAGLSCSGDTVHVTAVVRGQRDVGPATVTLHTGRGSTWTATSRRITTPSTKPGRNRWTLDASGLTAGVVSLRAEIRAAGQSVLTPVIPVSSCAPGTEVPEVPVAPLVPLTLAVTAAGVLAVRRRAESPTA